MGAQMSRIPRPALAAVRPLKLRHSIPKCEAAPGSSASMDR